MIVSKGTVSDFGQRTKRHVSWNRTGPNASSLPSVRYETITDFKLDGTQVNLSAGRSPSVANGDEVAVAGFKVFGELKALAFKNLSQNINWGNNTKSLIIAVIIIALSFLLNPQRLLQFGIINIQTYASLLQNANNPFSMTLPWIDIMKYVSWGLRFIGIFLFVTGLPTFIAYMRVKDT